MELGRVGKFRLAVFILQFGEARNDAAAVTEHADGAPLPVPLARLIGRFELAEHVDHVVLVLGEALQPRHETGPWTTFELVEHRGLVHRLSHCSRLLLILLVREPSGRGRRRPECLPAAPTPPAWRPARAASP